MVARDGIEPPTPAFSGPRSTTELSGLGIATPGIGDRQERPDVFQQLPSVVNGLFSGVPNAGGS